MLTERLHEQQLSIVEQIVGGTELPALLERIARLVEAEASAMSCAILVVDESAGVLRPGAAPSLPAEYARALDPAASAEACWARSAERRERVVVEDMAREADEEHRDLALWHGLRACVCEPIEHRASGLLGVFVAFLPEARRPTQAEVESVAAGARLAALAIAGERAEQRIEQLAERVRVLEQRESGIVEYRRTLQPSASEEHLRELIYRSVADILYCLAVEPSGEYRFLAVNPAFSSATRRPEDAVIGQRIDDVFSAADLPLLRAKYGDAIARRQVVAWEQVWQTATGPRHSELNVTPVFDHKGRCTNLVGTVRDITSRKQAEEEQKRLEQQLQHAQRLQALGTLTGGIAHDFNNVLAAIGGNTELGLLDVVDEHPAYECFVEIRKATRRATDLVRQILTFARQDVPSRQIVDLRDVAQEVIRMLRASFPASVAFEVDLADDTPRISADPNQMHQVLMNLGTNAALALGGQSGSVRFSSERFIAGPPGGDVPPQLRPGARYARISVTDDGCGMDDATLGRMFEPFFSTRPQGSGTGLGLSVVHGIVHHHEGAIAVESRLGRGTTFHAYFPARESAATDAVPEETAPAAGTNAHILFVDDEEALVFLASRLLPRVGYRVTGYTDALQALSDFRARPEQFEAIVTDMSMPGLSGPELVREVWQLRPDIPIIMTSGYIRPEDVECARDLGVGELVLKPHTMQDLTRVLRERLAGHANAVARGS